MNILELKKFIESLPSEDLDRPLLFFSEEHSISGEVGSIQIAKEDLYWTGEDDPSPLYTKKQLKKELGMDAEEIEECVIEIPKGSIVFNIGN